jgi:histidyl-tRNA synthetase
LFEKWRQIARLHAFQEYDASILEVNHFCLTHVLSIVKYEELFNRGMGEEIQHMYGFRDKAGRPTSVCLRPEMTPSLVRMILKASSSLVMPLKWFSVPQCWRYSVVPI